MYGWLIYLEDKHFCFHLLIILSDVYLFGRSFIEHLRRYVLKDRSRDNLGLDIGPDKIFFLRKILIIFLPINLNMCFGCSKEQFFLRTHNICFG